jgi:hypothetical protein
MKKHAKVVGSLGVAAALSMGIFAVTPVMAADLIPLNQASTQTSANVTVSVTVVGEAPSVQIARPLDGERFVGKTIPVSTDFSKSTKLNYELIYIDPSGAKTSYDLPTKIVAEDGVADGTDSYEINIDDYGGKDGDYILRVRADGSGSVVDSVQFSVISFSFKVIGKDALTNNPIISIDSRLGIKTVAFQVFDLDGNAILDEPIEVTLQDLDDLEVTIPLSKYGVLDGEYTIVGTAYDENGDIIDTNKEQTFEYEVVPAPDVPDTGFFSSLNLSRQDMISTGLALLIVCSFFAILLIAKRNKDQNRR